MMCAAASPDHASSAAEAGKGGVGIEAASSQKKLKLRIGDNIVPLDGLSAARLAALVAESNAARRIAGLRDEFNPEMLDVEKVQALVRALPAAASALPEGGVLYLNHPPLQLSKGSPVSAAAIGAERTLAIDEVSGSLVKARIASPPDCSLARQQSGRAREEYVRTQAQLAASAGQPPPAISNLRSRLFASAIVWRENAKAVARCAPQDRAASLLAEEAESAASKSVVAPSHGMPNL
jgi:hypothetical protein